MPSFLCHHCGHENEAGDLYCRHCGALREPEAVHPPDAAPPDTESARAEPGKTPGDGPEPGTDPETQTETPEQDTSEVGQAAAQPVLLHVLTGLIPERDVAHFGGTWVPAPQASESLDPATLEEMQARFDLSAAPASMPRPGKPPAEDIRRQFLLYAVLLLAALLPFWLGSLSLPTVPYPWDGTQAAWQTIQNLGPGSQVLVYWQNNPAVAGELDLPLIPVLTHLLAVPADLHLVTQHPLGLAQARELLGTVRRRQAVALRDVTPPATVQEVGYWPGGPVVLPGLRPWLATHEPDLQIVVSAEVHDVIHWLEQVAPHVETPVLAITSAGLDQQIRPYQDSTQLAGVVRGYHGAHAYARLNADRFPDLQTRETGLHMAAQNWVSTALILAFLIALLLRSYITPPWTQADLDS